MSEKDSINKNTSHLSVDKQLCVRCYHKPCLAVCPAGTYKWDKAGNTLVLNRENCLECGACRFVCPYDAIKWSYRSRRKVHYPEGNTKNAYKPEKKGTVIHTAKNDISKNRDSETEPGSETKPDSESKPEPASATVPESKPEPESKPDPETKPETATGSEPASKPEPESKPEPASKPESSSGQKTAPGREPESVSGPEFLAAAAPVSVSTGKMRHNSGHGFASASVSVTESERHAEAERYPPFPERPSSGQKETERLYLLGILPEKPDPETETQPAMTQEKKSVLTHFSLKYIICHVIRKINNFANNYGKITSTDGERDILHSEVQEKRGRYRVVLLLLALALLLFMLLFFYNDYTSLRDEAFKRIEKGVYYANDADWTGWKGADYEIEEGVVALSQEIYYAPYLMYVLSPQDSPWDEAVIKITSQLERFGGSAYTLLTVYTSVGEMALIADPRGRMAIVTDPDQVPDYSESVLDTEEREVYLFMDKTNGEISVYVDGNLVLTEERDYYMYTLLEIWLGAFWVGGQTNYGPPLDHKISEIVLGDCSLILAGYTFGQFVSEQFTVYPWLWVPFILAIILMLLYFFLLIRDRRRRKREGEIEAGEDVTVAE